MTHIIRQQHLHVALNGTESDGLALQRWLPGLCDHVLRPAIERALERCAPSGGHVYVERLEIDAGTLTLERLESDLPESVERALEQVLREQLSQGGCSPTSVSGNIRHMTTQHSVHEAFLYFLTTGTLPWSFRLPAGKSLEQVMLSCWQEASKPGVSLPSTFDEVRRLLDSPTVRERLIRQCSSVFLETLLSRISPEAAAIIAGVLEILRDSEMSLAGLKDFERRLWERVLSNIAAGRVSSPSSLVGEAWRSLLVTEAQQAGLGRVLEHHWPGATNKAQTSGMTDTHPTPSRLPASQHTPIDRGEHPEAREGIYLDSAGLVLLHPFLPRLFSLLGFVVDDRLIRPERALCLLHYVATGQTVAPEYALVLPKILCHVPLDWPVESDVELTTAEQEEAVALLESVIRHWEALRNTSPDGLRGTFLVRAGKVSLRDDGDWVLQVEANTADILLDQLPWGISMIKLPWMRTMLWVEWR